MQCFLPSSCGAHRDAARPVVKHQGEAWGASHGLERCRGDPARLRHERDGFRFTTQADRRSRTTAVMQRHRDRSVEAHLAGPDLGSPPKFVASWGVGQFSRVRPCMTLKDRDMRNAISHCWLNALWLSVPLCLGLLGCKSPTKHEVRAEFDEFLSTRHSCETDNDCVLVHTDCPLDCDHVVNAQHATSVERKTRMLVDDYESGDQSCVYGCGPAFGAECLETTCVVVRERGDAGAPNQGRARRGSRTGCAFSAIPRRPRLDQLGPKTTRGKQSVRRSRVHSPRTTGYVHFESFRTLGGTVR